MRSRHFVFLTGGLIAAGTLFSTANAARTGRPTFYTMARQTPDTTPAALTEEGFVDVQKFKRVVDSLPTSTRDSVYHVFGTAQSISEAITALDRMPSVTGALAGVGLTPKGVIPVFTAIARATMTVAIDSASTGWTGTNDHLDEAPANLAFVRKHWTIASALMGVSVKDMEAAVRTMQSTYQPQSN